MRILARAIGFVTNSSSANYWLNDGKLEEHELEAFREKHELDDSVTATQAAAAVQSAGLGQKAKEANLQGLFIWLAFSTIIVVVIIWKKLKNDNP